MLTSELIKLSGFVFLFGTLTVLLIKIYLLHLKYENEDKLYLNNKK